MAKTKTNVKHRFHLQRLGLFSLLFAAMFMVRFDAGHRIVLSSSGPKVLAYATEMSRSALLSSTNAARAANGLGGLVLDSQLNNSAQAKAQHMADNDYWAHVAPDGTQPWYFFDQAGYAYVRAGENLAYGFMSSQGAMDGWMASTGHKANVLGDYVDVGFGIVNTPSYQGEGEQTIVVAHYGSRGGSAPAPIQQSSPAPSTPSVAPSSTTNSTPTAQASEPTTTAPNSATPITQEDKANPEKSSDTSKQTVSAPVLTGGNSSQSFASMLAQKRAPILALASLAMISMTAMGYALTHRLAFHHALASGERYVLTHPSVDAAAVVISILVVLLTSYGHMR